MKTTQQLWASLFEAKKVDNEGDMAADQLFTIADAAEEIHDMLEDDTQLPSWVQSKIAKVVADLDSVRDYMIANFVDDDDMEDDEDEEDDMEESYQGKGNHKPGWMLKADPKLGAKVKANIDLAKKRQASYGNKDAGKSVKEENEQLDELSKNTLRSYADKAEKSSSKHFDAARSAWERGDKKEDDKNFNKGSSRIANASKARMKMAMTKEEAEQIDELSKSTLGSYAKKANQSAMSAAHAVGSKRGAPSDEHINKMFKRKAGVNKAVDRLTKEEFELDEAKLDKSNPIVKEYDAMKKLDIKTLRGMVKGQHRIIDTSELRTKDHAISTYLRAKHGNKKVDQAFGFSEETVAEEVDITEKLSVSQGMGAWIDDFKQSDAPQFKGKSDKERRDMAIAAFMSAKRAQKESVQESTDKDYIEQKLADADINASVKGKVVIVDKEDLLKAKAIVKKLGYTYQVKAGLNA